MAPSKEDLATSEDSLEIRQLDVSLQGLTTQSKKSLISDDNKPQLSQVSKMNKSSKQTLNSKVSKLDKLLYANCNN